MFDLRHPRESGDRVKRIPAFAGMTALFLVTIVYVFISLLYFFPQLPTFNRALIGPPEDNAQFLWFLWYGANAITNPAWDLMHTRMMYYPEGASLYYANYFYYGVIVTWVLKHVWGYVTIYNLLVVSSFVLSGAFSYLFLKYLTGNVWASAVGAFVFAFNPSHFGHALHHPTIASIQFIPLFVYFTFRALREGKRLWRFGAALAWALAAWCDWNYLVYGMVFLSFFYVYRLCVSSTPQLGRDIPALCSIGLLTVALLSPLIIPMIRLGLHPSVPASPALPGHDIYVADLWGFFIPHGYHALSQIPAIAKANALMTGNLWESAVYLGWVNLALVILNIRYLWKEARLFLIGTVFFCILAMGVHPHVMGHSYDVPFPYMILEKLPFLTHARNPARIMVFGYLFLSVLVALSVKQMLLSKKWTRGMWIACLALLFLDFYSVAKDKTPVQLPGAYQAILKDNSAAGASSARPAILDVPWDGGKYTMYQTQHGLPIMQGYLGRRVDVSLIARIPFEAPHLEVQKRILASNGVKYIVIHKRRFDFGNDEARDQKFRSHMTRLAESYSAVYTKLFEDDASVVFKL